MLRIYLPSSTDLKLCSDVPTVDFVDTWTFVTGFTSRYLGPNIWVLANKSKMICHQLWCNSEHSTMKKNSTMKIWQWKWQQWKFDNENGNNENLTMKFQQWKWKQWKFDNENSDNENLTMKMQQWKCQQWKMPTMKIQQWSVNNEKVNNENGRSLQNISQRALFFYVMFMMSFETCLKQGKTTLGN